MSRPLYTTDSSPSYTIEYFVQMDDDHLVSHNLPLNHLPDINRLFIVKLSEEDANMGVIQAQCYVESCTYAPQYIHGYEDDEAKYTLKLPEYFQKYGDKIEITYTQAGKFVGISVHKQS